MRTSAQVRASRLALVSMAALGAVALAACGVTQLGTGGSPGRPRRLRRRCHPRRLPHPPGAPRPPPRPAAGRRRRARRFRRARRARAPREAGRCLPGSRRLGHVRLGLRGVRARTAPCAHAPCTSIVRTLDRGQAGQGCPRRSCRSATRTTTRAKRRCGASGSRVPLRASCSATGCGRPPTAGSSGRRRPAQAARSSTLRSSTASCSRSPTPARRRPAAHPRKRSRAARCPAVPGPSSPG